MIVIGFESKCLAKSMDFCAPTVGGKNIMTARTEIAANPRRRQKNLIL